MTIYNNASEVWLAINLANSSEDILSVLKDANASNIKLDSNDLKNLALSRSVDAGGAKVVNLYAGNVFQYNTDGSPLIDPATGKQKVIYSGELAKANAASSAGTIAVIDNTQASKFVGDNSFKEAVLKALDNNPEASNQFFNGTVEKGVRTSHGLFGDISVKFVSENNFERAITFSSNAGGDSILFAKEVPTLLEKDGFKSVDGLESSYLKSLKESAGGMNDVVSDIKSSSSAHLSLLETGKLSDGSVVLGNKKFLENVEGVKSVDLPANASDIKSGTSLLSKDLSWVGSHVPSAAVLSKLGVAGDLLSLGFAVDKANAAVASNDSDLARDIMGKWAADFLGGGAGAAVAIMVVSPLIVVLAPGAIVAGSIAIVAGIVGGKYGGDAGVYLYEKAKELGAFFDGDLDNFTDSAKQCVDNFSNGSDKISDSLLSSLNSLFGAASIRRADPLALDLDGDGVERLFVMIHLRRNIILMCWFTARLILMVV